MNEHQASRTLLKSPPELWAECSDAEALARHLDTFGEIRITRLEPESTVAWEGERARGTVTLEPSGWGTRVTLTCSTATVEEAASPEPEPVASEPASASEPPPPAPEPTPRPPQQTQASAQPEVVRGGFLARVARFFGARQAAEPAAMPQAPEPPVMEPDPPAPEPTRESEAAAPEPEAPATEPEAPAREPEATAPKPRPRAAGEPNGAADDLVAALESLGQAHHRPFSRA